MRIHILTGEGRARAANLPTLARAYRREMRRRLGATATFAEGVPLERVAADIAGSGADVALVAFGWDVPAESLTAALAPLYESPRRPRVAFVDWYDQTSTPHFAVLPYVDAYVKPQVYRDLSWYRDDLVGGFAFTDFLAREAGVLQDDFHFGSVPDPAYAHRIVVGWNIGSSRAYRRYLRIEGLRSRPWTRRRVDVQGRFGLGPTPEGWYAFHRRSARTALEGLRGEFDVRMEGMLPRRAYMRELRDSKVAVSPFGWGEVCFRDFDAVCRGCLLIKPSMSHAVTSPDIFVPYETYVPVRWDLADLERACRFYLRNPDESRRIVANAREAYRDYFARGGFVDDLARVLKHLESPRPGGGLSMGSRPVPWRSGAPAAEAGSPLQVAEFR